MMSFEEFANGMADNMKSYLPEWYADAKVELIDMQKLNESYTGLRVTLPDEKVAPCLNMNAAYEAYLDGIDLRDIVAKAVDAFTMPNPHVDVNSLLDYESVKDKLFIRVSNAEKNQEVLAELPHTMMADLAVTYHIMFEKGEDGIASIPIHAGLMKTYGVSLEQLHEDALKSSPQVLPVKWDALSDIMKVEMRKGMEMNGYDEEEIEEALAELEPDLGMLVVTNEVGKNGASAIFYPGMMDEFAQKMDGDFFVIPSSTDEVLLMADNGELSIAQLNAMVQEVNETQVSEEMRLGNGVYRYDASEKIFEKASAYTDRVAQKATEKEDVSEKKSIMQRMDEKKKEIAGAVKDAVAPKRAVEAAL